MLTTRGGDNLPAPMGDGILRHQAVVNVLRNGIQATPPDGTVPSLAAQTEHARVLLTVCNTGQGIAPEFCRTSSTRALRPATTAPDWG